jgi:hypothetical protein
LTAFDAIAQSQLDVGPAMAASRLFHEGDLDDIPVVSLLTSLGCTER